MQDTGDLAVNKTSWPLPSGARGNSQFSFIDLLLVLVCVFHVCAGVYGGKKLTLGVFFSVAILFFETGSHTEAGAHQSSKTSQPTRHRGLHLYDSPARVLQAHTATPSVIGGWGSPHRFSCLCNKHFTD